MGRTRVRRRSTTAALCLCLCGAAASWILAQASIAQARPSTCAVSGGIGGPNPAYVGDTVSAHASVTPLAPTSCRAQWIAITGGGRWLCRAVVTVGVGGCERQLDATVQGRVSERLVINGLRRRAGRRRIAQRRVQLADPVGPAVVDAAGPHRLHRRGGTVDLRPRP